MINCIFHFDDYDKFAESIILVFKSTRSRTSKSIFIIKTYEIQKYDAIIYSSGRAVLRGTNYENLCDFHSRLVQCVNMERDNV